MRNTYTVILKDRYSAEERTVIFEAINDDHAFNIAHSKATESEYISILSTTTIEAEPQAREMQTRKTYTTTEGHDHQETTSAAEAMAWHREGRRVTVWGRRPNGDQYHISIPTTPVYRTKDERMDENTRHCKHIADELESYVRGDVRRCPECGEIHSRDWDEVGDAFRCPECHAVSDPDEWETLGVYDFLEDVYNVEFRVSGRDRDALNSVQVMVACGGPNIYLDTASKDVELYWWTECARWPLSYDAVEALDEWASEYWGCL